MCVGFVLGESEVHTLSQSAVSDPTLSPWTQNLVRKRERHLAATSSKSVISVRLCKVDSGTLKMAPRHIYQDTAVESCHSCSFGTGKICAVCRILEGVRYARTGCVVLDIGPDRTRLSRGL